MSYAIGPSRAPVGMGAYDPVSKPVFDTCTMNTTKGKTTWPPGWACNQANFVAALNANAARLPSTSSQTAIVEQLVTFYNGMIAGTIPVPAGFPPAKGPPPAPAPTPTPAPAPVLAPAPAPSTVPTLSVPSTAITVPSGWWGSQSPTVRYAILGGGALLLVGLVSRVSQ